MEHLKIEEPREVARLIALRTLKAIPRRTVAVLAVSTFAMLVVLWLFHVPPTMLLLLFLAVFLLPDLQIPAVGWLNADCLVCRPG